MRIVFFGSPEAALPTLRGLLAAGHEVPLVVVQPDRPAGRGRRLQACPVKGEARLRGIPVVEPERIRRDPGILDALRRASPEIGVVVAYGQIIPRAIIDLPLRGTINVHFSLLPKYRGAAPVAWAIRKGEKRTGATIFLLNEKMDEGDVLAAEATDILEGETAGELQERLAILGAGLCLRSLADIEALVPRPQNHVEATLAPKLRKDDGRIAWSVSAAEIDRFVRALTPKPSAFTFFGERRLIVVRGRPIPVARAAADTAAPGTILSIDEEGLAVSCGGGSLYRITIVRPESRGPMTSRAWANGSAVKTGERFV